MIRKSENPTAIERCVKNLTNEKVSAINQENIYGYSSIVLVDDSPGSASLQWPPE